MKQMLPASRPPLARILVIDQCLRENTWPNALTLAKQLEVDGRTIHRDIAFMRDQLRAPISFDRQHNGFYYTNISYQMPYFQASEGELLALLLGSSLLKQYQGTPFEQDLSRAFEKLATALPESVTISLTTLRQSMSVYVAPRVQIDPNVYKTTTNALQVHRTLQITYWSASSNRQTERRVDPYHLTIMNDDCFLIAYCHSRQHVLMFSMHRIRSCTMLDKHFTIPEDFCLTDYLGKSFRSVRGDEMQEVVLHFMPNLAGRIAERTWHSTQSTKPLPDGGLELRLEVTALVEVMRWVLSWGKDCRVVKPRKLQTLVAREHKEAAKHYSRKIT